MQQFVNVQSTETLTNSRAELINNDLTVMSCNSGTSFPTTNLQVGMLCLRTDLNQLYQLKDLTPTWIMIFDLAQVATNKAYVDGQVATCVPTSNVVTTATANKILQLNSSGQLPANITGNAATATSATAVLWGGIVGTPATFTPPVATTTTLGGVKQGSNVSIATDGTISVPSNFGYSNTSSYSGSTVSGWNPSSSPASLGSSGTFTTLTQNSGVGSGTYSLQSILQALVNISHSHGSTSLASTNCNCNCCNCGGGG